MGKEVIKKVSEYKYLGLYFSTNLKFGLHIETIIKKLNKGIGNLKRIIKYSKNGKSKFAKIYWKSKLRSLVEYGCVIWSNGCNSDHIKNIFSKQINFIRETMGYGPKSCTTAILLDNNLQDIRLRILAEKEKYIMRCELGQAPKIIQQIFEKRNVPYEYDDKLKPDKMCINLYPSVMANKKRKNVKWKSKVQYWDTTR